MSPGEQVVPGADEPDLSLVSPTPLSGTVAQQPPTGSVTDTGVGTAQRTAVNAMAGLAAEVLGKVATFAWVLVATRVLDQSSFGLLSYAMALGALLLYIPGWGFDVVLIQRGSAHPERLERHVAETVTLQLGLGGLAYGSALVILSSMYGGTEAGVAVAAVVLSTALDVLALTTRDAAIARQRQAGMAGALVVQRVVTAVLVLVALSLGGGLLWTGVAILAGSMIGLLGHLVAVHRVGVRFRPGQVTIIGLRAMARATWLVGITAVVLGALPRLGSILLEAFRGETELAAYAVAFRLIETVLFVAWVLRDAILPVLSANPDDRRASRVLQIAVTAAAIVYLPFATVCAVLAPDVIGLLFGQRYADQSALMLVLLAPTPLLFALGYFFLGGLAARGRNAAMLGTAGVGLVANLGLNLACIPVLGGEGAALATSLAYLIQLVAAWLLLRRGGIRPLLGRPLAIALVASGVLAVVLKLVPVPLPLLLLLGCGVYIGASYWLALRWAPDQLRLLHTTFVRRRHR